MIKLAELLNEAENSYPPYMKSDVGFGCHVCKYLSHNKEEDRYVCSNKEYQEYMNTHYLIDPKTKEPVTNPKKYCSNWFQPAK